MRPLSVPPVRVSVSQGGGGSELNLPLVLWGHRTLTEADALSAGPRPRSGLEDASLSRGTQHPHPPTHPHTHTHTHTLHIWGQWWGVFRTSLDHPLVFGVQWIQDQVWCTSASIGSQDPQSQIWGGGVRGFADPPWITLPFRVCVMLSKVDPLSAAPMKQLRMSLGRELRVSVHWASIQHHSTTREAVWTDQLHQVKHGSSDHLRKKQDQCKLLSGL